MDITSSYQATKTKFFMSKQHELNLIWINVNGLNSIKKGQTINSLLDEFEQSKYDCLMVQEPRYRTSRQQEGINWESLCATTKNDSVLYS